MSVRSGQQLPPSDRRLLPRSPVATAVYVGVSGGRLQRCQASNLSALGVFIEAGKLELKTGNVVSLVFPVPVNGVIRLHRKKAVVAHVSPLGAGLMMQGRLRRARQAALPEPSSS